MAVTDEEKAHCYKVLRHIERVRNLLNRGIVELMKRGEIHDQVKMAEPELSVFMANKAKLEDMDYEGADYIESRRRLTAALEHHYAVSRHHPEHFPNGVNGMTLIDLFEMFVDWKAASELQQNGNILKSIAENKKRFNIDAQLTQILENTAAVFDNT